MDSSVSANQVPRRPAASPEADWQAVLADAVCDPAELCRLLGLPPALAVEEAARQFPVRVPRPFLARIRPCDPDDPLLVQVLPRREELARVPEFVADPLGEAAAACVPGVLRKYRRRLLILASATCGVHCRFCFRRHFPYSTVGTQHGDCPNFRDGDCPDFRAEKMGLSPFWAGKPVSLLACLDRIASDESIEEVILSGGDPLISPDSQLADLSRQLAAIPHVRRLRVHTRLPIVIPQRVTNELLGWLRGTRLTPVVVVHVNHPAEIDVAVGAALGRLVDAGVPVLSQSVLLRGVNEQPEVMAELCRRLVDLRVVPYYLHQLDRVAGAAHFEVPEAEGVALVRELRARLPGYAVPRYVRDVPGAANKQVLA